MVVESWIMGKLLDFNHQSLTLRFMEVAKRGDMHSKAVDQTLTNSNRDLLERWLVQIETGRERLVEVLLRRCPLAMAARFLEQLESDRVDVVAAALEGGAIERYLDQMEAGNTETVEKVLQEWSDLGERFLTQMEKKRTDTVNSILDQDEALVERLLTQCEVYGNVIVDRLIAQIKNTPSRNSLALRLLAYLETKQYDLVRRLVTQMEVNDLCHEMATMICDKKDTGEEELGLRYLNELEKDRSPLVERVFKFETKNIACESRRMVIQLEKERTELVDFLLQIFEKDDHSMGLKFLQMVEDNKYDLVMKFCRENVFGTTEGNPTEGSTPNYDVCKQLIFSTDTFRDQITNTLGSQMQKGNFQFTNSLINEMNKQQESGDTGAMYGYMNTLFHYLEETPEQQLGRLVGPGPSTVGEVKDGSSQPDTMHNLIGLAMAMAINMSRK